MAEIGATRDKQRSDGPDYEFLQAAATSCGARVGLGCIVLCVRPLRLHCSSGGVATASSTRRRESIRG